MVSSQIRIKLPVAAYTIADACDKFGFAKSAASIREGYAPAVWALRDAMGECSQRNARKVAEAYHAYTAVCALHAVTKLATDTEIALAAEDFSGAKSKNNPSSSSAITNLLFNGRKLHLLMHLVEFRNIS
ncbi:MAG: hypothetical protein V4710_08180, partial [Verrucomicrobiota bacterium]